MAAGPGVRIWDWDSEIDIAAKVLTKLSGHTLDEWIGSTEAQQAEVVIADASKVLQAAVASRIANRKAKFEETYPEKSSEQALIRSAVSEAYLPAVHMSLVKAFEDSTRADCPACGSSGWLFGDEVRRELTPAGYDDEGNVDAVVDEVTYGTEAFACAACSLVLKGRLELDAAKMPQEFEVDKDYEPDDQPEYDDY